MSSSTVPLKTHRVGYGCMLNLSRTETSSRWCGVVVRRGGSSSGVVHVLTMVQNDEWLNSPLGSRPTVPNSVYATMGSEVHEQMFRSGGQCDAKPPVLSLQKSLVLIYRPPEGMKG
ncbi:hypothetical protein TNCV_887011 [Trichonephila clavipes]|uniref:Uncharacterized protein n=1 Tax=Trichonephila clavipes TaxID=2585209 RepID=A0A8X6V076_TRICX|nr:hypothetical protein TNCV_887011 [Trichonephila clavipes]